MGIYDTYFGKECHVQLKVGYTDGMHSHWLGDVVELDDGRKFTLKIQWAYYDSRTGEKLNEPYKYWMLDKEIDPTKN